jgi:hypothetical protein
LKQRQWPAALRKSRVSWSFYEKGSARREGSALVAKLFRNRAIAVVPNSGITIGNVVLARVTITDAPHRPNAATRPATTPATRPAARRKAAH